MVSLRRSSLACLSFCRSATALLSAPSQSTLSRRNFLTTGSIVTTSFALTHKAFASSTTTPTTTSTSCRSMASNNELMTGYLNAADAAALDMELMSSPGFSLEQLMELAGLAVAEAVYQVISPSNDNNDKKKRILLICGPGNNGGDGLVAARHLMFFGYDCVVVYPKRSSKTHFVNLVQQCEDVNVPIVDEMPDDLQSYDAIVDAIFGFSFKGAPREPFASALMKMQEAQSSYNIPVLSVDVPSGWNVDEGDVAGTGFVPQVLISLTTPKESARGFTGRHFVGGRFLPPKLAEKYNVKMPPYPGVSQVMEVAKATDTQVEGESSSGWEAEYAAYLDSKHAGEGKDKSTISTDEPSSTSAEPKDEPSWEAEYAAHCIEKEARLAEEDAKRRAAMKDELARQ